MTAHYRYRYYQSVITAEQEKLKGNVKRLMQDLISLLPANAGIPGRDQCFAKRVVGEDFLILEVAHSRPQ